MNEREIFTKALEIEDDQQRKDFIVEVCGDDIDKRNRIEQLLQAAEVDDSFLDVSETVGLVSDSKRLATGRQIGPYQLLEEIGEGGFGVVYLAQQTTPVRRQVALKIIKPGMDSRQVIARFEAERQALAIMDHPHIAKVLDAGTLSATEDGFSARPYFVMELVKGVPITKFCDERRLKLEERLKLFIDVCEAIQHAHQKGIIHRDIKPGNVLVALYDNKPVVKVIDFGIAKATGPQLTEKTLHTAFGAVIGSLDYMSPEQASFNQLDIDTRSDVYSLGVLLYELLTGTTPCSTRELKQQGMLEMLRWIREVEPPRPSHRLSTAATLPSLAANRSLEPARLTAIVRGDLDWIVMKALEKERERRYDAASHLAEELQRYLRGDAVLAHPPSLRYRMSKAARRHWQAVSLVVALLLITCLSAAWFAFEANQAAIRQREHTERVAYALEDATKDWGTAIASPIGTNSPWATARASANRLEELLTLGEVDQATKLRVEKFLNDYQASNADRLLAEQVERVVMMSATHNDLESWTRMEREFRELFKSEGIDVEQLSVDEMADKLRSHRSSLALCDAFELWIGTKGQLSTMGGPRATRDTMQPFADALLQADRDPVRSGIRRILYSGKPAQAEQIEELIENVELDSLTPRTLSWLASLFAMVGSSERADEIGMVALNLYPNDFMLNFDFAFKLESEKRWPEAIRYYLRCTALRPEVAGTNRALGNALLENGEHHQSVLALERAIELAPDHGPTYVDMARAYLMNERYAEAISTLEQYHERFGESVASTALKGEALMRSGDYSKALVLFERCDQLGTESPKAKIDTSEWQQECREAIARSGLDDR